MITEQQVREALHPDAFLEYLKAQPEDDTIGAIGGVHDCILARYLKIKYPQETEHLTPTVGYYATYFTLKHNINHIIVNVYYGPCTWIEYFIRNVDHIGRSDSFLPYPHPTDDRTAGTAIKAFEDAWAKVQKEIQP